MIVAGFGFTTKATFQSLSDALTQQAVEPDALATLTDKAEALKPFAVVRGLPLLCVNQSDAAAQTTTTLSARSLAEKGTTSVAEATALAAAGPGARLIGPRTISADRMATCAIAQGPDT